MDEQPGLIDERDQTAAPVRGRSSGLAPLRSRNYALFWTGFVASNLGRWVEQTGTVWLVYELTQSPVLLGLVGVAKAAPTFLVGPIAGVIADRVEKRRLLFTTQLLSLILSLLVGVLVAIGHIQLWHIYLQIALASTISAFDITGRHALSPTLVPRDVLPEAVTLTSMAARVSALVGPAVGGLAIAGLGVASPFLINAATFLALMVALLVMRDLPDSSRSRSSDTTSFRSELLDGLRHLREAPVLNALLRLELVFSALQVNPVLIAIVGREMLRVGPEGLGALLSAPALGSIIGLAALLILGHAHRQGRFVVVCQILYAAVLAAIAISGNYLLTFILFAASGLLDTLVTVTRMSVAQLVAPSEMRGRIIANIRLVTGGVGPLAQVQSGILAGILGPAGALLAAAGLLGLSATSTARSNPSLWKLSRDQLAVRPAPERQVAGPPG